MASETAARVRQQVQELIWRRSALRDVTAQLPARGERAFEQARLLREVVRQVAEPMDPVPGGHRPAVVLGLCREWVYWMLADRTEHDAARAPDLAALWRQTSDGSLLRAAGGEMNLDAVRRLLIDLSTEESLDVSDEDVARARAFAEALYAEVEAPRRRVDHVLRQRKLRLAAVGVVAFLVLLAVRATLRGPDLVAGRPFTTSSVFPGCADDPVCASQLFHTKEEQSPWVEFDLGKPRRVHSVEVENRVDCCLERAVPLLVELSIDHKTWKEVARKDDAQFTDWDASFPRTLARYVRLRVPRKTVLHLHAVKIR